MDKDFLKQYSIKQLIQLLTKLDTDNPNGGTYWMDLYNTEGIQAVQTVINDYGWDKEDMDCAIKMQDEWEKNNKK